MSRILTRGLTTVMLFLALTGTTLAAPFAAIVIDARDGRVLYSDNADARLHPASLTKMMTLYLVFEAVAKGQLSLDQKVKVSSNAASEPPSHLGLRTGERISVRDLIRAAAVKSANDAATALGEAVGGSEAEFAKMMTAKAATFGMHNTNFRNANGLTQTNHYSSARDMAILGRHLLYDYPQYYNLFSRKSTVTDGKTVYNTNRRLLSSYRGADGIKTGYTNAAGYNLVASAERGNERVIAVVFGGRSSRARNAKVAELLDLGFSKAPAMVAVVKPAIGRNPGVRETDAPRPRGDVPDGILTASLKAIEDAVVPSAAASTPDPAMIRVSAYAPKTVSSPRARPGSARSLPAMQSRSIAAVVEARPPLARDSAAEAWTVQLGAFKDRTYAVNVLAKATRQGAPALQGAKGSVEKATVKGLTLYRARLSGNSPVSAEEACAHLRAMNQVCRPVSD
ncbi:D-alanyl-D-alanine carboxypeptidase [Paroceanicella profunda]|uniref:D-alanyl-D-alanine carboxypeptidase n=1 Tax=Paroceanicella profunda TaxID=2579971 RepID=A0A5B8FXV7_9RHOB|nr:serine hydrolase [Paroceanicella profunda]QDL90923.1 D-alanyl-D-alanine carboxypeptidase [Paroceanicella profunda]